MVQCPSCGFTVERNWKVCPSCTKELHFPSIVEQNNVSAADSVITGDQFSGTKAETIIINHYGMEVGNNISAKDSSIDSKQIETTPPQVVDDQSLRKCSRCKIELSDSLQPINCVEPDCEKSMCSSCYDLWRVPQKPSWQYCQQHTKSHREEYELHRPKCSSCKTVIGYGIDSVNCEFDECNNTMCMTCYTAWYVEDPMSAYRSDSGPWHYCKNHTQESIDEAKQQLGARIRALNELLNQNISQWVKMDEKRKLESHQKRVQSNGMGVGLALVFGILIYPAKLFMTAKISGWLFTLYNIVCFWLMIPIALIAFAGILFEYMDEKSTIQIIQNRLQDPPPIEEFELKPNQDYRNTWHVGVTFQRMRWSSEHRFNNEVLRTQISQTLLDYDPDKKIMITKDEYSDGRFWTDETSPKAFALSHKKFVNKEF